MTILQALKVVLFCPQKWYSNCAAKIPCDVIWVPQDQFSMAESKTSKRQRGRYCVAGAPNQQSCQSRSFTLGIRMYKFPKDPVVRAKLNGFNSSADIDMTSRIRHLSTIRFVRTIWKNRVMRKTWPCSAVWRPRVLKRKTLCRPVSHVQYTQTDTVRNYKFTIRTVWQIVKDSFRSVYNRKIVPH